MFSVSWTQHPVGHGGFHTGSMEHEDGLTFTWAFDCGSRRTRQFDNQLRSWSQAQGVPLDWLFISHFDTDHVSGMETLLARTVVKDVMVPYLNEEEMMFTFLHEVSRDTLTRPFVEIASDPAAFFLSRGAERVTFMAGEGGRGEDEATAFDPDPPEERGSWFTKISRPTRRLPVPSWAAGSQSSPRIRVIDGGLADITITNGSEGLRLKPYRVPISASAHGGLVTAIRALVGSVKPTSIRRPGLGNLAFAVANHARTATGRKALRTVFKTYVGSSNRASLSLLSEPVIPGSTRGDWWVRSASRVMWRGRLGHAGNVPAWLNTGDAELLASADLTSWQSAYAPELDRVQVLALPHHGSDKNSDAAFQALAPDALLVAHVKAMSSKHPGAAVVHGAGPRLACVTEDVGSQVGMQFNFW